MLTLIQSPRLGYWAPEARTGFGLSLPVLRFLYCPQRDAH